MEILSGIDIVGLALYVRVEKALIISDLHIGLEEALNKEGILVPRFQLKRLLEELELAIARTQPKRIIINGDLKHEFGTISEQEWRDALKVLDYLSRNADELILIKGNHDTILGPIAGKRNLKTVESLRLGEALILHGNKIPPEKELAGIKTIIIGHEHPAVSIRDSIRSELFKCFLLGTYQKKKLIVMPSMNFVTEGTDVLREELLSPFLKNTELGSFEVYVVADTAYHFGKLKSFLRRS
jgi:putative SbcD/Mre11-related phosphoesterase